ncbi:hypothetical protein Taro_010181 [Colocasia esculenta]|uniref:Uncharacterized protein n=1 Tax=Colocasia esculenta TaxID=4460 RepID=A0A843U7N0_COLES|nr:hypothetical protein [Colocasia esculenta]
MRRRPPLNAAQSPEEPSFKLHFAVASLRRTPSDEQYDDEHANVRVSTLPWRRKIEATPWSPHLWPAEGGVKNTSSPHRGITRSHLLQVELVLEIFCIKEGAEAKGKAPHHPLGVEITQELGGRRSWRCFCNFLELPKESSGLCFCTDLSKRQGPWTPVMILASIDPAADSESAARDRRLVLQDRTVSCLVGDTVPSEEAAETDSERGD